MFGCKAVRDERNSCTESGFFVFLFWFCLGGHAGSEKEGKLLDRGVRGWGLDGGLQTSKTE